MKSSRWLPSFALLPMSLGGALALLDRQQVFPASDEPSQEIALVRQRWQHSAHACRSISKAPPAQQVDLDSTCAPQMPPLVVERSDRCSLLRSTRSGARSRYSLE